MHPTKFRFIWPNGFRREEFKQEHCPRVLDFFVSDIKLQINLDIQITGSPPLLYLVPHLIVNRYVEFHFNAYHNYWEIVFFEEILSQKGGITQNAGWSCLLLSTDWGATLSTSVLSFNSYWEILIILKKYPQFLCTMSKQGQITLDIQITGSSALL
jgi:hypothetical protein